MSHSRRERRKQERAKVGKKKYQTKIDIGSNYLIKDIITKPNGHKDIHLEVKDSKLELGHVTEAGKFKPALVAYGELDTKTIFNDDAYFCFVDTNKIKSATNANENITHLTGIYIFRVKKITPDINGASIETDYENSIVKCLPISVKTDENPELIGWDLAVKELQKIKAHKAKIFVDSEQNRLPEINTKLPNNYRLFYVSADRKPTIYNIIFSRLDKLINHTELNNGPTTDLYRAIDYLWGNIDHLPNDTKNK